MPKEVQEILDKALPVLCRELDVDHGLLPLLVSKGALTPSQIDECKAGRTSSNKVEIMIDCLKRSPSSSYANFRQILSSVEIKRGDLVRQHLPEISVSDGNTGDIQNKAGTAQVPQQTGIQLHSATGLHFAAQDGCVDVIKELIGRGASVNIPASGGVTPLHIAAQNGHVDAVKELIGRGASVNLPASGGATPLFVAAQGGHVDVVRELIGHKAMVDVPMSNGVTPLTIAAQNGHLDVVRELIKHGALVNRAGRGRQTPLSVATQNGHIDVVRELKYHGAKDQWSSTSHGNWRRQQ